jgi:DNA-binding NarL/FixJ family response regulator
LSVTSRHLKLAISSPDLLAHIRREFADKGLTVEIEGPPVVDVVVTSDADDQVLADALTRLAGPDAYRRGPATAHYRLAPVPARSSRRTAPAEFPVLSPREAQVMESIGRGMRNADIAAALRVTEKTVKNHVNRIFTKLGVATRVEAVLVWQQAQPT